MSEKRRDEKKDEKEEKDEEKRGEKEEKWRRDRGNALVWAAVLVWGALVILAETTDYRDNFDWWEGWAVFFAGAGTIILLGTFTRLLVPKYRRPVIGGLILGFVFLGIGLGGLIETGWVWAIILIAAAVLILVSAFTRRR
jgi:hypothetical protein